MFKIVIGSKGLTNLPGKIKRYRVGILARVAKMLELSGQQVAARSKADYLSGPRPAKLGRVSGDLARSIGFKISGNKVVIGTNLPYAHIHEKGYKGPARVKSHLRIISEAFGQKLLFRVAVNVDGFQRQIDMKARPFLSTALEDARPSTLRIIKRLSDEALKEALA